MTTKINVCDICNQFIQGDIYMELSVDQIYKRLEFALKDNCGKEYLDGLADGIEWASTELRMMNK